MDRKIAFFVDGGFFVSRLKYYKRKFFQDSDLTADNAVKCLRNIISNHERDCNANSREEGPTKIYRERYRVFYYDAPPFADQFRYPVAPPEHTTPGTKNFKKTTSYIFQTKLHKLLASERKTALRMGKLSSHKSWQIKDDVLKQLLKKEREFSDLTNKDFYLNISQKGVDARIGIDISTIALRGYVDTIVLVASDADFTPVAKLARQNGVDVILDPLYSTTVDADLSRHIDGKRSYDIVSLLKRVLVVEPDPCPTWWDTADR